MKKLILGLLMLASLATISEAQGRTRIAPPTIDYAKYGSLSRQLIVWKNTQAEIDRYEAIRNRKAAYERQRRVAARLRLIRQHERAANRNTRGRTYVTARRVMIYIRRSR